ncbi:aldose 1-epimerase [Bacillus sp. JJ1562]|uniref:aldose 1-epimerase n=1 Tax=Bacillus sp. JJ1562 TaxID=3122960 RepID=UPI0030031033
MIHERNYGCRIETGWIYKGMNVLILQNEYLKLSMFVDKGSDIFELIYKPMDIDFLWRSPSGIRKPNSTPFATTPSEHFMDSYFGGWQELFPSASGSTTYLGSSTGFHGEVTYLPWEYKILKDTTEEVEVLLTTKTVRTPFEIKKRIKLKAGQKVVYINETIKNHGNIDLHYMWGHHPAFGAPFLSEDCVLSLPSCEIISQKKQEDNNRFRTNDAFVWPLGKDSQGNPVDMKEIVSINEGTSDMLFARNLKEGWFGLTNQKLGIGIGMSWPVEMFPYIWIWQEFGGNKSYPWYGNAYTLAIEPFTSIPELGINGLQEAISNKTAGVIKKKQEVKKELKVVVFEGDSKVKRIHPSGEIEFIDNAI